MIIQLTHRDIIAHQSVVLWPNQRQVEQDLLLCRAMTALFNDDFLKTQIAMRGGTLLHKIHLAPPSRYSEDIDLVVIGDRPDEHIAKRPFVVPHWCYQEGWLMVKTNEGKENEKWMRS